MQDVKTARSPPWRGVFIADITGVAAHYLARQGILVSEAQMLHLHLTNGSTRTRPIPLADHYHIFDIRRAHTRPQTDSREPVPAARTGQSKVEERGSWYFIEFHRRFALPTYRLVLVLGIPWGLVQVGRASRRDLFLPFLVFAYYRT